MSTYFPNASVVKYFLEENGVRVPAHEVAERNGISQDTFQWRIRSGWSTKDAATKPLKPRRATRAETTVQIDLDTDLLKQIDQDRGEESRAAWITRMARDQLSRKGTKHE